MTQKIKSISIIFAIIFTMFFIFLCASQIFYEINNNNLLAELQNTVNDFNQNVTNNNSSNYTIVHEVSQSTYTNAKAAINHAFSIFYNMEQYTLECQSVATISALGQTIVMDAYTSITKYEDNSYLLFSLRYQRPHAIDKIYNLGLTSGDIYYFANGTKFGMHTTEIAKVGNILTATWPSQKLYKTGKTTSDSYLYIVNNTTIVNEISFESNNNPITHELKNYYASVELNAAYATKDYRKIFIEQTYNENVYFNTVTLHCVLDASSNLLSFRTEEKYTISSFVLGVKLTANISQTNSFTLFNEIKIKQPTCVNSNCWLVEV